MKQIIRLAAIVLLPLAVCSCVEINEDYDLNNIDTENITIGNEFVAPIGKVTTTIEDMLEGNITINPQSDAQMAGSAVVTFEQTYPISGGIDKSIIEMLTAQGELYLMVDIENFTPIFFTGEAKFLDAEGNVVCDPLGKIEINEGTNESASLAKIEVQITAEDLTAIGQAASVNIYYSTNLTTYTPSAEDKLVLTFKTRKTGGLSLDF